MKRKMKKFAALLVSLLIVTLLASTAAVAYVPYVAYNFDYYGEIVNGPTGYVPEKVLFGEDLGVKKLDNASDMYASEDGKYILIVDSGAADARTRVIVLNNKFKLIKIIEEFYGENNEKLDVINASGICMDKEHYIYLCDPDQSRVLKMDMNGKVVLEYREPPEEFVDDSFAYRPQKLGIGINGSIYVISKGCTDGIMEFDTNGTFVRFFGAPEVELSVGDYINIYWRNIYRVIGGDQVDDYFATYVPSEFSNLSVDENGFVFTMVASNESSTDEMYKLNFQGKNILDPTQKSTTKVSETLSANYGDLITRSTMGAGNVFEDVCLDDDGFFTLLDRNLGRLFEYDKEGNLIFVFGNKGNQVNQVQEGLLVDPRAVIKVEDKTVVLDYPTGSLTVFGLSDYGKELHRAVNYYNDGKYDLAEQPWRSVLKYDANSELAHIGLGKVHYLKGNYKEALDEFELGNDRNNYSRAYKLYRDAVIRSNFTWVLSLLVVLFVLLFVYKKFGKAIFAAIKNRKGGDQE